MQTAYHILGLTAGVLLLLIFVGFIADIMSRRK